ncbi:MAG: hypothetical protein PF517_12590 [Salinivirgaceae bacterium]|jgi:hypothetical protein|nr:hypothetical protein [Salinivirgaceae bacterium]
METQSIIKQLSKLGSELIKISSSEQKAYSEHIKKATFANPWFTIESVNNSLNALGHALHENNILKWLSNYTIAKTSSPKTIGLVLAGNIPLVGFHDLLCCLISGNNVLAKLSSKDQILYSIIKDILVKIDPSYEGRITFTEDTLKNIDAIIATGSDNSARYFEYYFNKYPNIIRKNRNSIGILSGNETNEDLENLGTDIFTYYGLGCRNVSFLWVPENYNFKLFFEAIEKFSTLTNHNKYTNNYEYQKAILLMNKISLFDNGFVLLKEDAALSSPIGVIHFQYYKSVEELENFAKVNKHKIQCVVSRTNWGFNTYGLGEAQQPELWDYADNVDTLEFLLNLK